MSDSRSAASAATRADNLTAYLEVVEKRLDSLAQRLTYALGRQRLDRDLADDPNARQSTRRPSDGYETRRLKRFEASG